MQKEKEYLFSGNWESRKAAIFVACMMLSAWLVVIARGVAQENFGTDIHLAIAFVIWAGFTYAMYMVCDFVAQKIMKNKLNKELDAELERRAKSEAK